MLKNVIKRIVECVANAKYIVDLCKQDISYDTWINQQERKINNKVRVRRTKDSYVVSNKKSTLTFICVPFKNLRNICLDNIDIVLVTNSEGILSKNALGLFFNAFSNKNIILCYGEEDVKINGERNNPWLKPDWSPNTFLDRFYFGSLIAFRKEVIETLDIKKYHNCYELCFEVLSKNDCFNKISKVSKITHIDEIVYHTKKDGFELIKNLKLKATNSFDFSNNKISVIIPSKDNPRLLHTCLNSFLQRTNLFCDIEFIIVDNGSKKFKKEIENLLENLGIKYGITIKYIYKEMIFNFSAMCNLGASNSSGDYLLFLNDDIEIVNTNWLLEMFKVCNLDYVGIVGSKLYYPNTDIIQHAGITNLNVGPAHKLQGLQNSLINSKGKNEGVHNILAVTGACMLMKKNTFDLIGGFDTNLAVAFNDVDLCFKAYKKGFYNVVLNNIFLYHHESISRGYDNENKEKQIRLDKEKEYLYKKHFDLLGKDPFYHKYFVKDFVDVNYNLCFNTDIDFNIGKSAVKEISNFKLDKCVRIGLENIIIRDKNILFGGYSFIIGSNNACYKRYLILRNVDTGFCYKIKLNRLLRNDIFNNLENQSNVKLTGFLCKISLKDLKEGNYDIGILYCNTFKTQQICNFSNRVVKIKN